MCFVESSFGVEAVRFMYVVAPQIINFNFSNSNHAFLLISVSRSCSVVVVNWF